MRESNRRKGGTTMMKGISTAIAISIMSLMIADSPAFSQLQTVPAPLTMPVWPTGFLPVENQNQAQEHDITTAKDGLVGNKPVIRLTDVSNPTFTVYWPDQQRTPFPDSGCGSSRRRLPDSRPRPGRDRNLTFPQFDRRDSNPVEVQGSIRISQHSSLAGRGADSQPGTFTCSGMED